MRRLLILATAMLLAIPYAVLPETATATSDKQFSLVHMQARTEPGSVTLTWPKANQSTIYLYRDYASDAKPIATLNPSDTSYTDKITGGHSYCLMVIGKDGSVAQKSNPLPVWIPDTCQSSDGTVIKMWIDKSKMVSDCSQTTIKTPPMVYLNSTYVSIRPIIEAAGGELQWNDSTRTATVILKPNVVSLTIGSQVAKVNGQDKNISSNPKIVPIINKGSTMLPFRFIVENLGGSVNFDSNERRLDISLPLQPNKAIARIMSAFASLSQTKLGQLVDVESVEKLTVSSPTEAFCQGARVLHFAKDGKPVATPLLDVTDVNGRKLSQTTVKNQYENSGASLEAYKVNIKSRNSQLPSFSTTVLLNVDSGDVIDATFLTSTMGLSLEQPITTMSTKPNGPISQVFAVYKLGYSTSRLVKGKIEFFNNFIPMTTSISGKINTQTPGCTPCQLGKSEIYIEFRNTCPDDIDSNAKLHLPLISNIVDFGLSLGKPAEAFNLSLEQGCGFFPSSACTTITEAQSDVLFEIADYRPASPGDNPRQAAMPVKGSVRLIGSASWKPETANEKSKNYITLKLSNETKPRTMNIGLGNGGLAGTFSLSSMMESTYPGNPPRIQIKTPLLSSPVGNQMGLLKANTKPTLAVTLPFEKVGNWFASSDRKLAEFGPGDFIAKSEFDCPCNGSLKAIENAKLAVETKGDHISVNLSFRVNTDVAFRRDNDVVEVQLLRNDIPLKKSVVSKTKPDMVLSDDEPEAGQTYMYCVKLFVNSTEIDQWCNPESIEPAPATFSVTWPDRSKHFTTKIMASEKFYTKLIVTNTTESEIKVTLYISKPCGGWKAYFANQSLSMVVTVPPNGTNQTAQITVNPDIGLSGGEICEFVIEGISGKQKQSAKLKAVTEAVLCNYTSQWIEGGSALGGNTAAGVQNSQKFVLTNTGNEANNFTVDINSDRFGSNTNQQWNVRFIESYTPGTQFSLKKGESRELTVVCRPANDMPDGEKIKISITIGGCGTKTVLTWTLTNVLSDCNFDLEWEKVLLSKQLKTYPGERFYINYIVKNKMDDSALFLMSSETKGELVETTTQSYELEMSGGQSKVLRLTCVTSQKAKIGQSKISVKVSCGRTQKTISITYNIVKQEECDFEIAWEDNRSNTISSDMPIDEQVNMTIWIKNKSITEQLFAVQIERSMESWISGINEEKIGSLKQTFTLNPGEEKSALIIYVKAGKETQIGQKCSMKIAIKACNTSKEVKWDVTCVPHQDLDVDFTCKYEEPAWNIESKLMLKGLLNFKRQGVGTIKATQFWFDFTNPNSNDAQLGSTDKTPLDLLVSQGMVPWSFSMRIPDSVASKVEAQGSNEVKIKMTVTFVLEKDKVSTTKDKTFIFIVKIPQK